MTALQYEGSLSDGGHAESVPVTAALGADGLSISGGAGVPAVWHYGDLLPAGPIRSGDSDLLLRNRDVPRAALFLKGEGIAKEMLARAPQLSPSRARLRVVATSLAVTVLFVAAAMVLFFGRFSASKTVASLIPEGATDRLGRQSVQLFAKIAPPCEKQPGKAALQAILARLAQANGFDRPFKLHVLRTKMANAFALPGRNIVLLSGLIDEAKSADEVAGVLAHEMGHGLEMDPEALFVRSIGFEALIQLLGGQSNGQTTAAFSTLLLQLRYTREAERAADNHAIEILRNAHVSPKAVSEFFLRHAQGEAKAVEFASYLNTHPPSAERAKLFSAQPAYETKPILSAQEWTEARGVCGS